MRLIVAIVILGSVASVLHFGSPARQPESPAREEPIAKPALEARETKPSRLTSTYSIVAFDPESGQLGVAVQSHFPGVGTVVPWTEPLVGAVVTQANTDARFGPIGLSLMRAGKSAPASLKALLAADELAMTRQVALIDGKRATAVHTGDKCIEEAGHLTGKNYSVQANLMVRNTVWPAMGKAFETAKGDLAERMLAALDAAQKEGGDFRGMQAAALIVVTGKPTGDPMSDRLYDLRVDDSREPLKDLRRLFSIRRAYLELYGAEDRSDPKKTLLRLASAEKWLPNDAEMLFWTAVELARADHMDEALPLFKRVFAINKNWKGLISRLVKAGALPDDPKRIQRITDVSGD